ncbi:MAG: redoxin domain-containing protein [Planctomycetales bacterium]
MAATPSKSSNLRMLIALVVLGFLGGAALWVNLNQPDPYARDFEPGSGAESQIEFADDVHSNSRTDSSITDLEFTDTQGKAVKLKDFVGKKNLVLAVMRGESYYGTACPYCSTQSSRLIANYQEFQNRDSEVVILFPVEKKGDLTTLKDFEKSVAKQLKLEKFTTPFPLLLDVELKAINTLGIRGHLAKPSTYILDKKGQVRFAYVGKTTSDRPSIKAMLKELDGINKAS